MKSEFKAYEDLLNPDFRSTTWARFEVGKQMPVSITLEMLYKDISPAKSVEEGPVFNKWPSEGMPYWFQPAR